MLLVFFFNDTATTEIYTLSLHDALPILIGSPSRTVTPEKTGYQPRKSPAGCRAKRGFQVPAQDIFWRERDGLRLRSEEHTSELQSRQYLVCRLLLEKKKTLTVYSLASS